MRAVQAAGNLWAVSPDGNLRYTSSNFTPPTWNAVQQFPSPVSSLVACESKLAVYAACIDGSVHTFDAASAQLLLSASDPQHAPPVCLLAHPNDDSLYIGLQDGALVRFHLSTLQFDCILGCGVEHKAPVTALEKDDQYVFSASEDGVILVWDPKEGNAVRELSMPSDPISSLLRVDAALWVGLRTGAVEVYDIFGDDTNGIECISNKRPHNSPVTDLLRVGDSEVWSIAACPLSQNSSHASNLSVAAWDTRDFSCNTPDELHFLHDLMSVTVVNRSAYEKVSLLALTNDFGLKLVETQVRGTLSRASNEEDDSMDELVSDLEHQLVQANEEINRLRQIVSPQPRSPPVSGLRLPRPSLSPLSRREMDHTNCDETCEDHLCPVRLRKEYYDFSGEDDVDEVDPLVITGSVSESINSSLNKVSELLVSLLADDVLTPEENVRGSNEVLRSAVASITRELNVSKTLIEKCTVLSESNVREAADENQPFASSSVTRPIIKNVIRTGTNETSTNEGSAISESESENVAKLRQVEKDLTIITKERDALCDDLNQLRGETEVTMTALEEIIEDKSSKIKERDALILQLRKECKTAEKRFEKERALRAELKENLETQLEDLSKAADATSKTFEEQLSSAYDKMETKSIEVQSQREVLHAAEHKLEALRSANQNLESKYNQLEEQLAESLERTDEVAREFASRAALCDQEYQVEIEAAKKKHTRELETLRKMNEELRRKLKACREDSLKEKHRSFLELQSVKDERDLRMDELNRSLTDIGEMEQRHKGKVAKLETEFQELKSRFNSEKEELERCLKDSQLETEVKVLAAREKHHQELQRRSALEDGLRARLSEALLKNTDTSSLEQILRSEVKTMTEERDLLLKEVEHREAAQKLFESEAENLQSAISDLRLANDELQDLLDEKEKESLDFHKKVEDLNLELRSREVRLQELEGTTSGLNVQYEDNNNVSDTEKATKAILASASGEMEQLTRQIDAMNRTYIAQERELNELREALSTRDEMLRLRNTFIDNLTRQRNAIEPLSSPGLSLNLSPDGLPSTEEINRKAVSPKSSRTTGTLSSVDAPEDRIVCDTLQEIQDGMSLTQDKLRELTSTARRYKRFAQSHLDVLPALHELEGELIRVSTADSHKSNPLMSAQGIVQSIIAQYYTHSQKRALLKDYDENLYRPSSERLEALHKAIGRLRKLRTGSAEVVFQHIDDVPNEVLISKPEKPIKTVDDTVPSTKRLLTFH